MFYDSIKHGLGFFLCFMIEILGVASEKFNLNKLLVNVQQERLNEGEK